MPDAGTLLREGLWCPEEVAVLLDVPAVIVVRWCQVGLIPRALCRDGVWQMPGAGLFLFCQRRLEPHYSVETVAALLDKEPETVRKWIKLGRLRVRKFGASRQASVRVPESELIKLMEVAA